MTTITKSKIKKVNNSKLKKLKLIGGGEFADIDNWVKTQSSSLPKTGSLTKISANEQIPKDDNGKIFDPPVNGIWTVYHASGSDNDCLIHSLLSVTSEIFRSLDDTDKKNIASDFRRKYFVDTIIPALTDKKDKTKLEGLTKGTDTTVDVVINRLKGAVFLTDAELYLFAKFFKIDIIVLCPKAVEKGKIVPFRNNSNNTVFIQNVDGKTHFQPLSINNMFIFLGFHNL